VIWLLIYLIVLAYLLYNAARYHNYSILNIVAIIVWPLVVLAALGWWFALKMGWTNLNW
jgi:hypothetical protein